ncbi:MAG: hypothetical protein JXA07_05255 [Spirochaetes bacterium]|nr:hypothetical protein [Spirochaetota bacterium]
MKKFTVKILLVAIMAACGADALLAGGINPSVSYTRTQSRAAVVASIDAAYFNPVGLAWLKDGLYIDVGYQLMTKTTAYEMAFSGGEDNEGSWFMPNAAVAYKTGKGAFFISLNMPEGLESMEYRRPLGGMPLISYFALDLDPIQMAALGNAGLTVSLGPLTLPGIAYVTGRRYWLQGRLGGAFALTDSVALTGGISCSYYDSFRSAGVLKGGTIDKIEKSALGWSGFAGVMVGKPDGFVVTALYSTEVIARGKEKNVKYNYTQIMEQRYPDSLMIGVNIMTRSKASFQLSYQVDFTGERNYGTRNILARDHEAGFLDWALIARSASAWSALPLIAAGNAQNYKHRNRHSFGIGMELEFSGFVPGTGLSISTQEKYPRAQNPLEPDLFRIGYGAGLKAKSGGVVIETGAAYYFYITDRMLFNSIKLNRTAWTWGASVSMKVM